MKKIYTLIITFSTLVLLGCGDNNYDGENGLQGVNSSSASVETSISTLYQSIIQEDATKAYDESLVLLEEIQVLQTDTNETQLLKTREQFKKLTLAYKSVESVYIAGYNSDEMRDVADFYIEQFIKGSKAQDTAADLEQVFAGKKSIVTNALKGITALEYTLFGNVQSVEQIILQMNTNRLEAALLMATNLVEQFKKIQDYYSNDTTFTDSSDDAISSLLNVLVDSSYRLRESRIGDAAGFTVKYKDDLDPTRLEYFNSTHSLNAIKKILLTHKRVLENGLSAISIAGNATSEGEAIGSSIDEALSICEKYTTGLEVELSSTYTLELYESIGILQNNYTALINGLNFTQDIIEADGD